MIIGDLKDIVLLILGWLLGLLAPAIVASIRDEREGRAVKIALLTELRELQYRLVLVVYKIESRYGELNHDFFNWAKSILEGYSGVHSVESLLQAMATLLNLTKSEVANLAQYAQQQKGGKSGIALKKYTLSLLETNMVALNRFDPILRGYLLEVKTRIDFMNEIIEDARYYFRLSFQNDISPENYNIATANMIDSYKTYEVQAREVVGVIGKVLNS